MNLGWQVGDAGKTIGLAKVKLHQRTVWAASRRSWKPLFSRKVLMLSPSQKHGWDDSHDGSAAMAGYKRQEKQERWLDNTVQ